MERKNKSEDLGFDENILPCPILFDKLPFLVCPRKNDILSIFGNKFNFKLPVTLNDMIL